MKRYTKKQVAQAATEYLSNKLPAIYDIEKPPRNGYPDLSRFVKVHGKCWHWTGQIFNGLPRLYVGKQKNGHPLYVSVPKLFYLAAHPSLRWGKRDRQVRRTCGNNACVNPAHLATNMEG